MGWIIERYEGERIRFVFDELADVLTQDINEANQCIGDDTGIVFSIHCQDDSHRISVFRKWFALIGQVRTERQHSISFILDAAGNKIVVHDMQPLDGTSKDYTIIQEWNNETGTRNLTLENSDKVFSDASSISQYFLTGFVFHNWPQS